MGNAPTLQDLLLLFAYLLSAWLNYFSEAYSPHPSLQGGLPLGKPTVILGGQWPGQAPPL